MKKNRIYFLAVVTGFLTMQSYAQNVAINEDGSAPNSHAILDVKSSTKGVLIPRMSTADRLAISATKGLLVYDTTTSSFWYNTGIDWQNMAAGATTGTGWSLSGNSGTNAANFLGTTDFIPLRLKVNSQPAGLIDHVNFNTFFGYHTGRFNTSGTINTANGHDAFASNTTGNSNTASGGHSMFGNTTGNFNAATGASSLFGNVSGSYNTAMGPHSLEHNTIGDNNTALGSFADVSKGGLTNATAIGYAAIANNSNKVRIGNGAVTVIEGQVPFTTPSDGRFKYQVQEDVRGLDFILQLRPVTYQFDVKQFDEQLQSPQNKEAVSPVDNVMQAAYTKATAIRRTGFIAQEVEKAAMASGYNFSGLIKPTTEQDYYSLSYESFVVPLVKAIQELNRKVASLEKENALLKAKK